VVAKHDLNGVDATKVFQDGKNDHQILNATLTIQRQNKDRKVILLTKDIALRLKAKSLNIISEDYLTGKVRDVRQAVHGPHGPWTISTSEADR
jgi:PhoH-like ATPase